MGLGIWVTPRSRWLATSFWNAHATWKIILVTKLGLLSLAACRGVEDVLDQHEKCSDVYSVGQVTHLSATETWWTNSEYNSRMES